MTAATDPADETPRAVLDRLIRARGLDYSRVSRLLGRNPAYIQQYVKRGTPRQLAEQDRMRLAQLLGVGQDVLGGPQAAPATIPPVPGLAGASPPLVIVPQLAVGASAGIGAHIDGEPAVAGFAFDARWLRRLGAGVRGLSMISVSGDSMAPALNDGDDILVDGQDVLARLRDGIYVLRMDDQLMVKRVARTPVAGVVAVTSDNPQYPRWPALPLAEVQLIGRVVWSGRRIS